ncbi:hypothetical protein ACYSNL_02030 [Enterococcus cecorum]
MAFGEKETLKRRLQETREKLRRAEDELYVVEYDYQEARKLYQHHKFIVTQLRRNAESLQKEYYDSMETQDVLILKDEDSWH